MSSNQPRRGRGWEPGRRGRGRGREGDDEECARDFKKVRPATLGDALVKSSPSSEERQPARDQGQPIRAAMPSNQSGRGWGVGDGVRGRGRGRGWGREGHVDEGTADSEKGRQLTLPEHDWPALPSSSSSTQSPAREQKSPNSQLGSNDDTADSKQGRLPKMNLAMTRSSPSSGGSTPRSLFQTGVVTHNNQSRGIAGATSSEQGRCLREGKCVQEPGQRSRNNTPSPSSFVKHTPRFTAPREQRIMQYPTPSSGSDVTLPSNKLMRPEKSSGEKLSYIGIVEKGEDPDRQRKLSSRLTTFLNDFKEDGATFPYYQAELAAIKLRSPFSLTVEFKHLIRHDVDLAFQTWKYQGNMQDWLLPAVCDFLKFHKYDTDSEIMMKTRLTLSGFPLSMRKAVDVLKNAYYTLELLGGESQGCEARADAKLIILLFFTTIFTRHSKDESYDGNFSANDMWLVNNAELQICRPCVNATVPSRLKDLKKGGEELLPYFKGSHGYPAYFAQLEEDIRDANTNQIVEPWCMEYFCFHMAGLPSMTRRNLELALHYISKNVAIELKGIFEMLSEWKEYVESSGCKPLTDVLDHTDTATCQKVKYDNTIGGLVKYKRHYLEHVVFAQIFDVNEVELFGAKKFSSHLTTTVKMLLKHKKMSTCVGAAWSSVKSSRFDARDTPIKQ